LDVWFQTERQRGGFCLLTPEGTVQEESIVYAIVGTGGKQYKVATGEMVDVELLPQQVGEQVELSQVYMVVDGDDVQVGSPLVEGASIVATVTDQVKGKKVRIFKYSGKRYRRRKGHRQRYTRLRIDEIRV
jgi:large subunit ribosomal protein L21